MKALVTGATGFIGTKLVEKLNELRLYDRLYTTSRKLAVPDKLLEVKNNVHFTIDLSVQSEVERMFAVVRPDIVYHLGGNPIVKTDEKNPTRIWQDNVIATHNLLHFCPKGCKFIFTSSVLVYGDNIPNQDWKMDEYSPCKPTSVYGLTKLAAEELVRIYTEQEKVQGKIVRLCAIVGVGNTHGVVKDLINKCKNNDCLEVIGDCPGSSKSFVYINDCIDALIKISDLPNFSTFNVASDDIISCEDIAKIVIKYFGKYGVPTVFKEIKWLGNSANWAGDNKLVEINNNRLKNLGWVSRTAKESVEMAIRDYCTHDS